MRVSLEDCLKKVDAKLNKTFLMPNLKWKNVPFPRKNGIAKLDSRKNYFACSQENIFVFFSKN